MPFSADFFPAGRAMSMTRLALGTVQFGLNYGVANKGGIVSQENVKAILKIARGSGVDTLDTAIDYGNSENCLGQIGIHGFKVITKLPAIPENQFNVKGWVHHQINLSLQRLGEQKLYGLLLHRPAQLADESGAELADSLIGLKADGLVEKVGVSIYDPDELESAMAHMNIDLVQAPLNVFDRRLVSSGWLDRLHDAGVEVHTRSAFLQGLLLMPRQNIPAKFARWHRLFDAWHQWLETNGQSATEACLQYALSFHQISRVVVGVEGLSQLAEICAAAQLRNTLPTPVAFSGVDMDLINPSRWVFLPESG